MYVARKQNTNVNAINIASGLAYVPAIIVTSATAAPINVPIMRCTPRLKVAPTVGVKMIMNVIIVQYERTLGKIIATAPSVSH